MNIFASALSTILLVDDESAWLRNLSLLLGRVLGPNEILTATSGVEAIEVVRRQPVALVILDITMPGLGGEQVLEALLEFSPELPVIIHTGRNEVEIAVRCMKLGAFDYYLKTSEQDRLITGVRRALTIVRLRAENHHLQEHLANRRLNHPEVFETMISRNNAIFDMCVYLEAIARSREPVLITGESGVGKELVAHALWKLSTPHGPWQAVNVAGLDDLVFSDTLFGHVRGAFTGADQARSGLVEQASGGVLFLDEIGDLSLSSQIKLLRLLQGGDYLPLGSDRPKRANVRIISATNLELESLVKSGHFRRDLYYRLKAHHVHIPPLRERREDVLLLCEHFVAEAARAIGRQAPAISDKVLERLSAYDFPGNIRELRSLLVDAVTRCTGEILDMTYFPPLQPTHHRSPHSPLSADHSADWSSQIIYPPSLPTLEMATDHLVNEAMRRSGGNQTLAARILGMTRQGLAKRLKR